MKDLLVARQALIKDRTATSNRAHQRSLPLLKAQADERLRQIERQIDAIDAALREQLESDPALKARFDILVSIPGLGEATAFALLIDRPELGHIDHKCATSLAGLAPMARERGPWRGKRFIRGGQAELRHALFMPALVAIRSNPDLRSVYEKMTAAGKPAKIALIAVMRRVVVFVSALLRKHALWTPKPA